MDTTAPDLEVMSWQEALRYAKEKSGLTAEQIAKRMMVKTSVIRRYLQNDSEYAPGLDKIASLCWAMNNTIVMQWLESQLEDYASYASPAKSRLEVMTAIAQISASLGDIQRILVDSEQGGIDRNRAKKIRGILAQVIEEARKSMGMIQFMAQDEDENYRPLASLKSSREDAKDYRSLESLNSYHEDNIKKPWWKFWKK